MGDVSFRMSEQINEIAAAIAKAQAELENVEKAGLNPAFRAAYAKLGSVLDEVRPKFAKHGIAITQIAVNGEGSNVGVITLLAHSSGQWIEGRFYVAPTKFDAQGAGSAITYCRRYALMAMTGVAPDDDDANAAVGRPERHEPRHRQAARQPAPLDDPFSPGRPILERPLPPHPEEPPVATADRAGNEWWGRDDYGINPEVIEGGIVRWDHEMLRLAEAAPNLDAYLKLKEDNRTYFSMWSARVARPVIESFNKRLGAAHRRLADAEAAA